MHIDHTFPLWPGTQAPLSHSTSLAIENENRTQCHNNNDHSNWDTNDSWRANALKNATFVFKNNCK